ncbi:MAG TPA: hypothetical protein VH092_17050, partial [Urbifossiella sp.]|nr:hypothetical protein [Urbifossiella sp.]
MSRYLPALLLLAAAGCGNPLPAPPAAAAPAPADTAPKAAADEGIPAKSTADDPASPKDEPAPRPDAPGSNPLLAKIKLPADGGKWPAVFHPAAPAVEGKSVKMAVEYGVHTMVVSPESGRFLLVQVLGKRIDKSHNNSTRLVLGDVI